MAGEPLPEIELHLAEPIEFGGKSHSSVMLREPKAGEVQHALAALGNATTPDSVFKYNTALMAKVSGLSPKVIEALPVRQFNEGAAYLESFLAATGPTTGGG